MTNQIYQAHWAGEPCNYACVVVKVLPIPPELLKQGQKYHLHWSEAFVGELRQAVMIHPPHDRGDFYIDNDDGLGMFKIMHGGKAPYVHRDLPFVEQIKVINSESRWRMVQNWKRYQAIQRKAERYWSKTDPEGFKKMKAIEAVIKRRLSKK